MTFKKRPALVIQTGHVSRLVVSVATAEGRATGQPTDSVIVTDNVATVRDAEITHVLRICRDTASLDAALRHTLGL